MEEECVEVLQILQKAGRIGIFMTKQETYDCLRANGVEFEITEHAAVYNMAECAGLALPYPADEAKNLFVRDHLAADRGAAARHPRARHVRHALQDLRKPQ